VCSKFANNRKLQASRSYSKGVLHEKIEDQAKIFEIQLEQDQNTCKKIKNKVSIQTHCSPSCILTGLYFNSKKYNVSPAIEKEKTATQSMKTHYGRMKEHREQIQAKLTEKQQREPQATSIPCLQRYRENYNVKILTSGSTEGTSTSNRSRVEPTTTEPAPIHIHSYIFNKTSASTSTEKK
jgi:hypothetical protein